MSRDNPSLVVTDQCMTGRKDFGKLVSWCNRNRNRKLDISRPPTKAKSWEPAYSQALNQNKIDRQRGVDVTCVTEVDIRQADEITCGYFKG